MRNDPLYPYVNPDGKAHNKSLRFATKLAHFWLWPAEMLRRLDDWLHDPKSSFNVGSEVPVRRELLDPNYPDWLIKGKKYEVSDKPDWLDKLGAWFGVK